MMRRLVVKVSRKGFLAVARSHVIRPPVLYLVNQLGLKARLRHCLLPAAGSSDLFCPGLVSPGLWRSTYELDAYSVLPKTRYSSTLITALKDSGVPGGGDQ